jgi:hypothetical protein
MKPAQDWTTKLDALIRPVDSAVPPDSFTVAEYTERYGVVVRSARERLETLVSRGLLHRGKKYSRITHKLVNAYWFADPEE